MTILGSTLSNETMDEQGVLFWFCSSALLYNFDYLTICFFTLQRRRVHELKSIVFLHSKILKVGIDFFTDRFGVWNVLVSLISTIHTCIIFFVANKDQQDLLWNKVKVFQMLLKSEGVNHKFCVSLIL